MNEPTPDPRVEALVKAARELVATPVGHSQFGTRHLALYDALRAFDDKPADHYMNPDPFAEDVFKPVEESTCSECGGAGKRLSADFDGDPFVPCPSCTKTGETK